MLSYSQTDINYHFHNHIPEGILKYLILIAHLFENIIVYYSVGFTEPAMNLCRRISKSVGS